MEEAYERYKAEYASMSPAELRTAITNAHLAIPERLLALRHVAHKRKLARETAELTKLLHLARRAGKLSLFAHIDALDVRLVLQKLQGNLPAKPTAHNIQLNPRRLRGQRSASLQNDLQAVADRLCAHLRIAKPVPVLTVAHEPAGKYQYIDGRACILINDDLEGQDYDQKLAILAHELAHHYLIHERRILVNDEAHNELLTEVAAIYLGMGILLLRGYHQRVRYEDGVNRTTRLGYLTPHLVYEGIIDTAYLRKQAPPTLLKSLPWISALTAIPRLWPLYKDYRTHRKAQKAATTP